MTTRRTAAGLTALAALTLAACSNTSSSDNAAPTGTAAATTKPAAVAKKADCSDPNLSQADWTKNCDKGASSLHLQFGQTYTWPDGVKATITRAAVFTDYNKDDDEHATPGETGFRVYIKVTNGSRQSFDLSALSTAIDGATNGGEASTTTFTNGSAPLEGRVAPGGTVTKTDDDVLENKYGRKIVVTLQRTGSDNLTLMDSPEFTGSITN